MNKPLMTFDNYPFGLTFRGGGDSLHCDECREIFATLVEYTETQKHALFSRWVERYGRAPSWKIEDLVGHHKLDGGVVIRRRGMTVVHCGNCGEFISCLYARDASGEFLTEDFHNRDAEYRNWLSKTAKSF